MAMFHVRFLKDVCNDTGHTRCILQRAILVEAQDHEDAGEQACRQFCEHESIGDWRHHADRLEVDQVDWSHQGSPQSSGAPADSAKATPAEVSRKARDKTRGGA